MPPQVQQQQHYQNSALFLALHSNGNVNDDGDSSSYNYSSSFYDENQSRKELFHQNQQKMMTGGTSAIYNNYFHPIQRNISASDFSSPFSYHSPYNKQRPIIICEEEEEEEEVDFTTSCVVSSSSNIECEEPDDDELLMKSLMEACINSSIDSSNVEKKKMEECHHGRNTNKHTNCSWYHSNCMMGRGRANLSSLPPSPQPLRSSLPSASLYHKPHAGGNISPNSIIQQEAEDVSSSLQQPQPQYVSFHDLLCKEDNDDDDDVCICDDDNYYCTNKNKNKNKRNTTTKFFSTLESIPEE